MAMFFHDEDNINEFERIEVLCSMTIPRLNKELISSNYVQYHYVIYFQSSIVS